MYNGDKTYIGQPYLVDDETGEGHFRGDWNLICDYERKIAKKIQNPKDGQRVGHWTVYDAKEKEWFWTGPSNSNQAN
jgi:hypothetical protein